MNKEFFETLFLGAGPGGTGPLFYALKQNKLAELLDRKIAVLDKSNAICKTRIGKYRINSDTMTDTFLELIEDPKDDIFHNINNSRIVEQLHKYKTRNVPLTLVGKYLQVLGNELQKQIESHNKSRFFSSTKALSIHYSDDNKLLVKAERKTGNTKELLCLTTRSIVLGLGGKQTGQYILEKKVGDVHLKNYKNKIFLTDRLLQLQKLPANIKAKKILIIGSSHSAFASARHLLNILNYYGWL